MPTAGSTHDIVLTIGGTDYGYMLAKGENGAKLWNVYDSETVADRYTTSAPGYANFPTELEIVNTQSDWREGMGWNYATGARYSAASNLDARWKDLLILGPAMNTTTIAASATLDGAAVKFAEYGDVLWLACTNKLYKWNGAPGTLWVEDKDFGASVITDLVPYQGWLYIALGGSTNYQVTDGTGTYWAASHANSMAKYFAVLNRTLFKGNTPDEVKNSTTSYIDVTPGAPTIASIGAGGAVDAGEHKYRIVFFDGTRYSGYGTLSAAATTETTNLTVNLSAIPTYPSIGIPAGVSMQRLIYRNKIADQSSYYYRGAITDNTTTTYADTLADSGLGAVLTQNDPWSAAAYVGDKETDITNMIQFRSSMYVGKEEGLYTVATDGTVTPVITEFRVIRSTLNFTKMAVWQNQMFFQIGKGGIYVYDGTNVEYIGWDLLAPDLGLISNVGAFIPGHDFLYVLVHPLNAGGLSSLYSLRQENVNGSTDWRWHGLSVFSSLDTPSAGYISTLQAANPRLWVAGNDANPAPDVNKPQYLILPQIGSAPQNDANCRFHVGSPYIITGYFTMGFPADLKLFTGVDILCKLPAGNTITLKYEVDNDTSYTTMGTNISAGPIATRYVNATGRRIRFQIILTTDSSSETPEVYGIAVRAILRSKRRKIYEFAVKLERDMQILNGNTEKQSLTTLATQLKNADDPTVQTGVVTLYDRENASHSIVFVRMNEKEVSDKSLSPPHNTRTERVYFIRAVEAAVA